MEYAFHFTLEFVDILPGRFLRFLNWKSLDKKRKPDADGLARKLVLLQLASETILSLRTLH